MEALYLDCGVRKPQLKRDPLGCSTLGSQHELYEHANTTVRIRPSDSVTGSIHIHDYSHHALRQGSARAQRWPSEAARLSLATCQPHMVTRQLHRRRPAFGPVAPRYSSPRYDLDCSLRTRVDRRSAMGLVGSLTARRVVVSKLQPNQRLKLSGRWRRFCRKAQWRPSFLTAAPAARSLSAIR
jgi:hypothetical protein